MYPTQVSITSYAASLMGVPGLQNSLKTQSVEDYHGTGSIVTAVVSPSLARKFRRLELLP